MDNKSPKHRIRNIIIAIIVIVLAIFLYGLLFAPAKVIVPDHSSNNSLQPQSN